MRALREELRQIDEQAASLRDDAEDSELRAIVSDLPGTSREALDSRRHADAMARHRERVIGKIRSLEARQDALLDRMPSTR